MQNTSILISKNIKHFLLLALVAMLAVSCYGPIETTKYVPLSQIAKSVPDSGAISVTPNEEIIYDYYPTGQFKTRRKYNYKSKRKTMVEEHRYRKIDMWIMFTGLPDEEPKDSAELYADSVAQAADTMIQIAPIDTLTGEPIEPPHPIFSLYSDTVVEAEIFDKQFRISENIYRQKRKLTSYHNGTKIIKEKTKKKSKFRDGCEIPIYIKTKMYDDEENLVYKETFCFLMWRQVKYIYDGDGKLAHKRVLKCMFKPKFRNYP